MSLLNKTEKQVKEEVLTIAKEETGLSNFKSTGVLRRLVETIFRVTWSLYSVYLNDIYRQTNLGSASGTWLRLWGVMLGVKPKVATKTVGSLSGVTYAAGKVAQGVWIEAIGTKLRFKVAKDTSFTPGKVSIPVESEFPGAKYNIAAGTPMRSTRVIAGLRDITVPADWITDAAIDDESDKGYRARITAKWLSVGEGNPTARYEALAASVRGVAQSAVIRAPRGWGSLDLLITSAAGPPSTALINAVKAALKGKEMMGRDFLVRGPHLTNVAIKVEFAGDYTPAEVSVAIRTWVLTLGIGQALEVRHLYSTAVENFDFTLYRVVTPVGNTSTPKYGKIFPVVTAIRVVA